MKEFRVGAELFQEIEQSLVDARNEYQIEATLSIGYSVDKVGESPTAKPHFLVIRKESDGTATIFVDRREGATEEEYEDAYSAFPIIRLPNGTVDKS
jgi:hypothetical protein